MTPTSIPLDETVELHRIIQEVYRRFRHKRSADHQAAQIGIPVEDYLRIKDNINQALEEVAPFVDDTLQQYLTQQLTGAPVPTPEKIGESLALAIKTLPNTNTFLTTVLNEDTRVTETKEDLETGTGSIKGISVTKPRSPEEVIEVLKIDTEKWALKQYWNKEKAGRWEISALVARRSAKDFTAEDMLASVRSILLEGDVTPVHFLPVAGNRKALWIYTSDKHIASHVSDLAVYENDYNALTYEARMDRVREEIARLVGIFGVFDVLYLADFGDKMDGQNGQTTRGGHKLPQNMTDREAFEACLRVEKRFYDQVFASGAATQYQVYQNANSNHGGDFDYMVSRAIEEYLHVRYPEVGTRILQKFIEHETYGLHTILMTHGKDDIDMKHGLPRHLNDKAENYLLKYLMYHRIDRNEVKVSVVKGDLHVDNSEESYGFRYRNVMSLYGGSKWIMTNYGPTRPGCSYDIYFRDEERVLEGKILFDARRPLAPAPVAPVAQVFQLQVA